MPLNDALRANMARVKRATKAAPQKFACILGRETVLLINPAAKHIADAKKEAGGGTVISGTCFFDSDQYIFETPGDPPGTLVKALKTCLLKSAGISAPIEARKSSADEEEASESESDESTDNALKTKITNQVKTLQTRLANIAKTDPAKAAPIRAKITQAGAAFKSAHFDEAEQLLDEAEELF